MLALALGAWLGSLMVERRRPADLTLALAGAAYVGWGLVSWAAARGGGGSLARVLGMAALALLLLATADLARAPQIRRWVARAAVAGALVSAVLAVVGVGWWWWLGERTVLLGGFGDLAPGRYARARALTFHPNALASVLVFAAALVRLRGAELRGAKGAVADAVLTVAVVLTFSRSILTFLLVLLLRAARPRSFAVIASSLVMAALAVLTFVRVVVDPTRPWRAEIAERPATREQNLAAAWQSLAANPLFGAGPGALVGGADGIAFEAHMTALNVAATMGLPALAAFALIVGAAWRAGSGPRDPALHAALVALALDSLAGDIEDFRHLWVLLGLTASDGATTNDEITRGPSSP